jgi:hypothetical protein
MRELSPVNRMARMNGTTMASVVKVSGSVIFQVKLAIYATKLAINTSMRNQLM